MGDNSSPIASDAAGLIAIPTLLSVLIKFAYCGIPRSR
jgi:hypothetical protein